MYYPGLALQFHLNKYPDSIVAHNSLRRSDFDNVDPIFPIQFLRFNEPPLIRAGLLTLLKIFLWALGFTLPATPSAQTSSYTLRLEPVLNGQPIVLNTRYQIGADSISISKLKFYISDIALNNEQTFVCAFNQKHHLVDIEDHQSMILTDTCPKGLKINRLCCTIGIDSLTNVSGVFGADLDPTNGMYWTWQSGYINVKLEGISSQSTSQNHTFQFHLGGYQQPYVSAQQLEFPIHGDNEIVILVELDKYFSDSRIKESDHVMSPGARAMHLSQLFARCFKIKE